MTHSDPPPREATAPPAAPAPPPPSVSVVVLAYNSAAFLPICLDELGRSQGVTLEVIVVDNASADDSHAIAQAHPAVDRALRSEKNLGCAGGNNLGWRAASHPLVVFLNPDCAVDRLAVARLVAPLIEDPAVGLTGAKLYYPNSRRLQHAGGILYTNAMCEHHGMGKEDHGEWDDVSDVDYVTGAFIAVRRADLEALGGFDEEYWPAYYEETDLCTRLRRSAKAVRFVPAAVGWHWESVGLGIESPRFIRTSYRARMTYVVKNATAGWFMTRFLPFEVRWFCGPYARGYRWATICSYAHGVRFALFCLSRFRRRPRANPPRLSRTVS
ncbi:MAG: glycosyltransferase family 2 protein [Sumerlaeia bacterium]